MRVTRTRPTIGAPSQLTLLSAAIGELTERQGEVFAAIALNDVPIDVLAVQLGSNRNATYKNLHVVATDLRGWINEGLMTLFFLVVGLEAKRELDLGELRDRRRLAVPVLAGLSGVVAPTTVYLAVTSGQGGAGGWGDGDATGLVALLLGLRRYGRRRRDAEDSGVATYSISGC